MPRPVLHNRCLPGWIHRLANGAIGGLLAVALVTTFLSVRLLWVAIPVVIVRMLADPTKFSLVEGCAGNDGYDELDVDDK